MKIQEKAAEEEMKEARLATTTGCPWWLPRVDRGGAHGHGGP